MRPDQQKQETACLLILPFSKSQAVLVQKKAAGELKMDGTEVFKLCFMLS